MNQAGDQFAHAVVFRQLGGGLERAVIPLFDEAREQLARGDLGNGPFHGVPFLLTDLQTAELVKVSANAFLATSYIWARVRRIAVSARARMSLRVSGEFKVKASFSSNSFAPRRKSPLAWGTST